MWSWVHFGPCCRRGGRVIATHSKQLSNQDWLSMVSSKSPAHQYFNWEMPALLSYIFENLCCSSQLGLRRFSSSKRVCSIPQLKACCMRQRSSRSSRRIRYALLGGRVRWSTSSTTQPHAINSHHLQFEYSLKRRTGSTTTNYLSCAYHYLNSWLYKSPSRS